MPTNPRNDARPARKTILALLCLTLGGGVYTDVSHGALTPVGERASEDDKAPPSIASTVERPAEVKKRALGQERVSPDDSAGPHAFSVEDQERIERLGLQPDTFRVQFHDRRSIDRLRASWRQARQDGLRIVHVGDSHVQNGAIHKELRSLLRPELGDGGHGLLFPYSAAKTYAPKSYRSRHRGRWTYAKSWKLPAELPLGVTGMSVETRNPDASFTLTFKEPVPDHWRRLRIYCDRGRKSFDLKVDSGGRTTVIRVHPKEDDGKPYVEAVLPKVGQSVRVRMRRRGPRQKRFQLHGMSLESVNQGGLVVHNGGVGASRFRAILHEDHFESHLTALEPDLVIVEYGTNDYLYEDRIKPELESEIRESIGRIRRAVPDAMILLVSAQDLYRKSKNLKSGVTYSDLLHKIAAEESVGIFDWYWISGGGRTLPAWRDARLARKDLIHLTSRGYRFKGRLLAHALRETFGWLDQNPSAERLVLDREPLKRALAAMPSEAELASRAAEETAPKPLEGAIIYRVKPGECLAGIATRNGVTVKEIMTWNRMKNRRVHAGRELQLVVGNR